MMNSTRNRDRNARIRVLKERGIAVRDLAMMFDLSVVQVYRIVNRKIDI